MMYHNGFGIGGIPLPSLHIGGRGFVNEPYELQFPGRMAPPDTSLDLDPAWIEGAEPAHPGNRARGSCQPRGYD